MPIILALFMSVLILIELTCCAWLVFLQRSPHTEGWRQRLFLALPVPFIAYHAIWGVAIIVRHW